MTIITTTIIVAFFLALAYYICHIIGFIANKILGENEKPHSFLGLAILAGLTSALMISYVLGKLLLRLVP